LELALWFQCEDISQQQREEIDSITNSAPTAAEKAVDMHLDLRFNVVVTNDSLISDLNRDFRHKDSLTDVLSFPLGKKDEINGEIYICWSRVLSQAEDYGHTWQREYAYLLVHGILHLLGYEHGSEPCPEMRKMEEKTLGLMEMGR